MHDTKERILVLAPTAADAALSCTILSEAHLQSRICADLEELARELAGGAGAILLTEDVLVGQQMRFLAQALERQPSWSDVPILLLSAHGSNSSVGAWAMELLGNVTILERPVRVTTLVSSLRTAVRARRRQYELQHHLEEVTEAETRLRLLWETASVLLTTEEPDVMMRALFNKIAPHLQLDAYFNFMVTETADALQLGSYFGIPDDEAGRIKWLEFGQAICGSVALSREPMVATYIQQSDDPRVQLVKGYGIRVYACSPLIVDDRLLGTLSFASRQRDEFDSDEIDFLRTISYYVTVAYERLNLIHQLRDIDKRKDEFLATLAHELRNPLAPIHNALEILRLRGDGGPAVEQVRSMMERQLHQMVRLIDDLLDVSRITRGKLELRKERVNLAAVIESAVDTARPLIDASGHELVLTLPQQPVYLDADPMRLAQVFANLLNNAAKYMERGGQIWLSASHDDGGVVVRVRDTGIGIAPEMLPFVFDMFTQLDSSLEKSQGGLGIGLTLVKRLLEMHGGSVEVLSDGVNAGSEFVVRMPVALQVVSTPLPAERSAGSIACRILVADDNRDSAESMGEMLRLLGNEVRTVSDGMQAVEEAAIFRPDVVLLDIGMPRLNGYDTARIIREKRWGKHMRLIALTGWGQEEDKRKAIEAGFDRHFTKPVKLDDLERLVSDLVLTQAEASLH
jgi:signal transduction histidine kinase/ActR/RegA family two-component response regulator